MQNRALFFAFLTLALPSAFLTSLPPLAAQEKSQTQLSTLQSEGEANLKRFKLKEAEAAFRQALSLNPKSVPALLGLSAIYRHYGKAKLSNSFIEQAVGLEPNNPKCYIASARLQERMENYPEAIRAYKRAVALDPKNDVAWERLGWNQMQLPGGLPEAEISEKRAISINTKNDGAYNLLAWAQANQGRLAEGKRNLQKASELAPKIQSYQYDLANMCLIGKDRAGAKKIYLDMQTKFPKSGGPYLRLASMAQHDGKAVEAERLLRRATEVQATSDAAWRELAIFHMRQRNLPECLKSARIACGFNPRSGENNFILGVALMDSDKLTEAAPYLEKAVKRAASLEDQLGYKNVEIHLKFLLGKNDEAMAEARDCYRLHPEQTMAVRSMAWALMCFKKYDEGFALLKKLMVKEPDNESIDIDYMEGLYSAERYTQAKAVARKILKREPEHSSAWMCLMSCAKQTKNSKDEAEAMAHLKKLKLSANEAMEVGFEGLNGGSGNGAVPMLKKGLDLSPESADIILNSRDPK